MRRCAGIILGSLVVRGFDGRDLGLLLSDTLLHKGIVFCLLLLLAVNPATVERTEVTAALETDRSDQSLDFGCLSVGLGVLLLRALHLTPHNVLPDIIFLRQVEEPPDLRCPFGTKSLGQNSVGEPRDIIVALFDDNDREDGNVRADDATTDRFALPLAFAAGTVARVIVGQEKSDTDREEDTLHHRETLLVVTTSDTEDVTLPFVSKDVCLDLLRDLLVEEDTESLLIIDVNGLLSPSSGVGNVDLHTYERRKGLVTVGSSDEEES